MPFLGHVVSTSRIEPDVEKLAKIKNSPTLTDVTGVRCFFVLPSYYCRFVPNFAVTATPLNKLMKTIVFEWSEDCEESFNKLKYALVTAPVLVYPKFGLRNQFILETDATTTGLGAILSQMQVPFIASPALLTSMKVSKGFQSWKLSDWCAVTSFRTSFVTLALSAHTLQLACPSQTQQNHLESGALTMDKTQGQKEEWEY